MVLLWLLLPIGSTAIVAFLIWLGLSNPGRIAWGYIVAGLATILFICFVSIQISAEGLGMLVVIEDILAAIAALVAGIALALYLRGKRRLFGIVVIFLFPLLIFLSYQFGDTFSSESVRKKDGSAIAQALDQYRAEKGTYPELLDQLVPQYLAELRQPKTVWGWLYISTASTFSLGYVYDVDKWFGYSVCTLSSSVREWDCQLASTGPFGKLPPTPFPDWCVTNAC